MSPLLYSEELRKEARQLKRELLAAKQKKESATKAEKGSEGKGFVGLALSFI